MMPHGRRSPFHRLKQGRDFDAHDGASAASVEIVNRTLAERYFAGENPVAPVPGEF
jgi:hypothetical protein